MKPFHSSLPKVRLLVLTASLVLIHSLSAADARPQGIQEALKQRGFYFGEVNGVVDDQTKAALKRFQVREGLTVTGEIDAATVAALQKKSSNSGDASLQKIPARERAQSVIQSDQEFLNKVESMEGNRSPTPLIGPDNPPPAPERSRPASSIVTTPAAQSQGAITNEPLAPVREPPADIGKFAPATAGPESAVERAQPARKGGSGRKTNDEQSLSSDRERPAPVAERISSASHEVPPASSDSRKETSSAVLAAISPAQAREFVQEYLKAAEGPTPAAEVAFYGDQVDYFDIGRVSRTFVEKDQRNYYRRWPVRNFELVSPPQIDHVSDSDATVRFRMRYSLSGSKQTAKGLTENVVRVRKTGAALKIVAIRERKIRE